MKKVNWLDKSGNALEEAVLEMPVIKSTSNEINEIETKIAFKAYPNPFKDKCLIDFT